MNTYIYIYTGNTRFREVLSKLQLQVSQSAEGLIICRGHKKIPDLVLYSFLSIEETNVITGKIGCLNCLQVFWGLQVQSSL